MASHDWLINALVHLTLESTWLQQLDQASVNRDECTIMPLASRSYALVRLHLRLSGLAEEEATEEMGVYE